MRTEWQTQLLQFGPIDKKQIWDDYYRYPPWGDTLIFDKKITGTKPKNHLRTLKVENRLQRTAFLHWEFVTNFQEYLKPVPLADFIIRDGYPDPKGRTVVDNKAETEVRITFDNGMQSILSKVTDFGGY